VDRQGEVRDAANVRQVDGDAFYLQDGRWVQSGEKGERKVRVVKQFSDEYFELVNSNARFAKAQALDAMVTINIGNEIVEVR